MSVNDGMFISKKEVTIIMSDKNEVLSYISLQNVPVSMGKIKQAVTFSVSERTVRRWLNEASNQGKVTIEGEKRTRTYLPTAMGKPQPLFHFLAGKTEHTQQNILDLLRDYWTHESTSLAGNSLSLPETKFVLGTGLAIDDKPVNEHQEILGHAAAILLVYRMVETGVTKQSFFDLHQAVQSELCHDRENPCGAWRAKKNGRYIFADNNTSIYLEYVHPSGINKLMNQVIKYINSHRHVDDIHAAIKAYVKIHLAITHINPFCHDNARIARLVANIPLISSGLLPIVIPSDKCKQYFQMLSCYELAIRKPIPTTGISPKIDLLHEFEQFCFECYQQTVNLVEIG